MFPLCPEKTLVTWKNLSPAARKLLVQKIGLSRALKYKSFKLISSFKTKRNYVIHYMTLV